MIIPDGDTDSPLSRAGVTRRETEVLAAVAGRLSNPEIAEQLYISVRTVESHIAALLRKTGASDRRALIRLGLQLQQQARAGELREPVTTFVGRTQELADIERLLRGARLLTLTGPGGVGKTRLALRAAAGLVPEFRDGVALADLAALGADASVTEAIARSLGLPEQPAQPVTETLRAAVRHHDTLLVTDNCEQVIDEVARCIADLLPASRLRVLATSREPLDVPGEVCYPLEPLTLPAAEGATSLDELASCEAVQLFTDRARAAAPTFALTDNNAEAVAELCRRLDGLPLALELAAVRVRTFSPHHLLAHLDRRFDLLTAGARTAPARHRTLAATIGWSHDALAQDERRLFERLSVFPASFEYAAVEAVCGTPPLDKAALLVALPRLLDTSLVTRLPAATARERYQLLETLRHYGRDQLPPQDTVALRQLHASHYLVVAETAAPRLKGPDQDVWLARLTADQPNLNAALTWAADQRQLDTALRLLSALAWYWTDTGQRREAAQWIARILARGEPPSTSVSVTALADASFLLQASDVDRALQYAQRAVDLAAGLTPHDRAVADLALGWALAYQTRRDVAGVALHRALACFDADTHPWERATALQGLALATDQLDVAIEHARRSAALFRRVGDRRRLANTLYTMADGALNAGTRLDDAQEWLEESLTISRTAGSDHDRAHSLLGLARLAWTRDRRPQAEQLLKDCVPMLRRLGDQRCTGRALHMLGELARRRGDTDVAGELLTQSIRAAEPAGDAETLAKATEVLAQLRAVDDAPQESS